MLKLFYALILGKSIWGIETIFMVLVCFNIKIFSVGFNSH